MKEINFAVVGLGHRGRNMFQLGCKVAEKINPVAACDIDSQLWFQSQRNEKPLSETFCDTKFYEDFEAMLEHEKIDVLLVETPAHLHAEFCAKALKKNINVLSDIPLVRNYEEAQMLWNASNESKAILMTGANPNEWGFVEAMHDLYKQGLLGNPFYLEAEYIHDLRCLWKETPWRKTLQPIKYCTHSLGPLLKLLPEDEIIQVSSISTGSHICKEEDQHDLMTAHFSTQNNVVIRLTISFINEAKCGSHSYRVFGTEGYFEHLSERGSYPARTMFNSKKLYGTNKLTELPISFARTEFNNVCQNTGHGGADYVLFHDFFNALRSGNHEKIITLKDGLRMTLPGIFAAESANNNGKITQISYPWNH